MKISLSPINSSSLLAVEVKGDTIILNGEEFDFGFIPEGGELPPEATNSEYFYGNIARVAGQIEVCIFLPYTGGGHFDCPPFLEVSEDGPVDLPVHYVEPEEYLEEEVQDAN